MDRTCTQCGEAKALAEFYRNSQMRDGYLRKCKSCVKANSLSHRATNADYYREYDRKRARDPQRVKARQEYAAQHTSRPRPEPDPVKRAARVALGNAVRDGKLTKPTNCDVCGQPGKIHGHHDDYSKPLEVVWCCPPCHGLIHGYLRAKQRKAA